VRDYLKVTAEKDWRYQLTLAIERTPRKSRPRKESEKSVAVLGLQMFGTHGDYSTRLYTLRVGAAAQDALEHVAGLAGPREAAEWLDANRSWSQHVESPSKPLDFDKVLNLSPEGVYVFNLLISTSGYYGYGSLGNFYQYLPLVEKLDIPLFVMRDRAFGERLHVHTQPAPIEAALAQDGNKFTLQAGVKVGDVVYSTLKDKLKILSYGDPAWALAGQTILPIANPEALEMMHFLPLSIPQEDAPLFREHFFQRVAERMPVVGDLVTWVDVDVDPVSRLYLTRLDNGAFHADLRFGYGEHEVDANLKAPAVEMIDIPGSWGGVRVNRRLERESACFDLLTAAKYGLKRAGAGDPSGFDLRARTHPFDFLTYCIPALTAAGFEIYGQKILGNINRAKPTIRLNITSGIDWFDIQAVVLYDEQQVSMNEIRKALKKGEKYIKLADGSIGQIPEEWLERYKHLFEMAEESESGLRVSELQIPLLDELLADADQATVAAEFNQKRERLKNFNGVAVLPVPQGFNGELRPYQRSGLDWLGFLHDYGFGGILADDMGLGKTIQVLAFLQSLRERGLSQAASLLVVPKSLLANWQREASRFTPELRILEFMGVQRKKDSILFQEYDVVLTTYGTMLRDIEFLREYRFHYAVLDESQAIKNPVGQSSKAARLINAEHRLCMTGTPVENNTFELWAQFAFANPGLLGSLDYFRREFSTPIETRKDEFTAQLLRRMAFPFILRRTKEQVAPELPPRTERLIYTDLQPAQRKLYAHTRDYYRGMLMGLLDDTSVNDVRMKILEGLLRLRQICIHPQLVEPAYRGESAKFEILLETLDTLHAEGHKALVFSQFVQTLHLLEKEMQAHGLPYTYLDGQTRDRQERVDEFQNDPSISFFLISLKAGGLGLNLTAADYVIHLDPWWNPAVEMQATDRAHRIGQDKPVFIYKFIARDTVEEKILELQSRKRELVDQLVSAEGSFFKSITKEDVKVLFS
jgi:non-specific serine/threonine protein kinase